MRYNLFHRQTDKLSCSQRNIQIPFGNIDIVIDEPADCMCSYVLINASNVAWETVVKARSQNHYKLGFITANFAV